MSTQNDKNQHADEQSAKSSAPSRSPVFWGIIAILGGTLMILSQFMELDAIMPWLALIVGVVMLLWGIVGRSVGGLIAGGIVTGVGVGITLVGEQRMDASEAGTGYFLLCLALGFLSIPLTTKLFIGDMHWWAFIPGGIILLVGLALIFGGAFLGALSLVQIAGALALVTLGVWLIYQYATGDKNA